MLEHIIHELYPKKDERKKIIAEINQRARVSSDAMFAQLVLATEKRQRP